MQMKQILMFMLICFIGHTIGCGSAGGWTKPHGKTTKKEYWTPNPGVKAEWEAWHFKWAKDAKQKLKDVQENNGTADDYLDDAPDPDAPHEWQGLGPGMEGQDPPPWAILQGEGGKPAFCLEEPSYGDCDQNQTRWGYNPFVKECQLFKYSGCGGNQNNFRDKVQCVASCELTLRPNCAAYDD